MIPQLLLYKILQLFIIMILGFILVKIKIAKSDDSIILSKLSLYLFMPSVILNAFKIEMNNDMLKGLTIAFLIAILIHIVLLAVVDVVLKHCKATIVERASIIYSNAGNLIVPIVTYVLGKEWLIYSSAFLIVQIVFLWTHGVGLFCNQKLGPKKILTNINVVAVLAGFIMVAFNFKLPFFAEEIISSLAGMLAPTGMLISGMLAASVDFGKMLKNRRLYFVIIARLIVCPIIIMFILRTLISNVKIANVYTIALISYFASITPTASTVMQFAQIYGKDAEYATAINAFTTIGCVVTMPLLIIFL